jgi:hypothetical protein
MALLKKKQFDELVAEKSNYCVSIYIPTHKSGENKDSMIRLKNQVSKIEDELIELGVKQKDIFNYVKPINKLLQDTTFWRYLSDSLAIFRSKETFVYRTLPIETEDFSMVSDRFYLLPLLSVFNNDDKFYILQLSLKKNRLFEANQYELNEIPTEDYMPQSIKDAVGWDVKQKTLQYRSGQSRGGHGLYHGQGEGKEDKEKETLKYLHMVDNGLNDLIDDKSTPLIIASVEEICSHFKQISSYDNIYSKYVLGNHDNGDMDKVHQQACELLQPYFERVRNESKEKYAETNLRITSDLNELLIAANGGRIDTLFVGKNKHIWGNFDVDKGTMKVHEEKESMDYCLMDFAAKSTFQKGGNVFLEEVEDLPASEAPANAILRY